MTRGRNREGNVALFVGGDISSHLLVRALVPALLDSGYQPLVYFPAHRVTRSPLPELRELAFFERELLEQVVYPHLDDRYSARASQVEDVNAPAFLAELEAAGADVGISIRCYQKFRRPLIDFFDRAGEARLWNLHPGILPAYRGVMTIFRSMLETQDDIAYTLHVIDETWDGGPVVGIRPVPLVRTQAMLTSYCELAPTGVPLILDALRRWREGGLRDLAPQDVVCSRYHTFPTRAEVDAFLARDFRLVDPADMRSRYLAEFSAPDTQHHSRLALAIDRAIADYGRAEVESGCNRRIETMTS